MNTWMIGKNMEDINDADYMHAKTVCNKRFRWIPWFVCSKLYSIVAGVFNNFQIICLEIYGLDPALFLSVSELVW